ncbi:ShlB/FhaC/HecB family hemolysin secretion/activation protein [Haloferula sp. BvORR071]|uniref:ShlB/FhaC/HecB family hemolysin secretion/activation protein n=1 Tax=Haloferula sp. BvORR071 TaxID=1396141 RepID=UPI000550186D|nr:ShlB/FhaC/HecB family hemolysin secretion/activation protein [Haloferula sp. BvORR071]
MRLLLALVLLATARGQSLPGIGPRVPEAAPVESLPPVKAQGDGQQGGEVIAARLDRIILIKPGGSAETGVAEGLSASSDLVLPSPQKLAGRLAVWLGKPLTSGGLAALADEILIHYDECGYPVVLVEAPEQDLSKGELRLSVEIGRYGEIGVSRPKYGKPEVLQKGQRLVRGEPVRRAEIDEELNWYGRTTFRHPRLFVSPGTEPATADLLIAFEETKPWRVTTGYENSGPDLLGKDRLLLGVVGWTPGEQLIAWQTVAGLPPSSLLANALHWEIPFHSTHQLLQLDAAYAEVRSTYLSGGIPVESEGSSWSLAALQKMPLPPVFGWQQSLGGGFELKGTDQFLLFGGGSLSPGEVVFFQGKLQHELSHAWENGGASFTSSFYVAPGNLGGNNDDAAFQAYDPAADSSYVFGRLSGEGWWSPGKDWQLRLRGAAQVADSRLLPAEQFAAGGYQTVRGTGEREFAGDSGWQGSFEVLSPLISPLKGCDFRLLTFFDYAALDSRSGGPSSSLYSTGLGLRMRLMDHLDLRLDHGWRLDDAENRTHVGMTLGF